MNIYQYITLNGETYDLSKIKPIDEPLFIDYCKRNGKNYGFWSKLSHVVSFWLYGNFNDDTINAYNFFAYRHNNKIRKQQVRVLQFVKDEKRG